MNRGLSAIQRGEQEPQFIDEVSTLMGITAGIFIVVVAFVFLLSRTL